MLDNVFDLSREFPPLRNPAPLALDTSGIAKAVMALYTLTESIIEKAILPLCGGLGAAGGGGGASSPRPVVPANLPAWPLHPLPLRNRRESGN